MRGQCRVGLVETQVKICLASRKSNAVKNGEGKRSAEPPLPAPLSAGRRQGAGSSMSTACLSDFRIGSPVLLVDSTACGCCVQWLQHLYSLDLIGSAHGSPPRSSMARRPQSSSWVARSVRNCTTERSVSLGTIQKLSTCRSGPVTAVAACHGTWTQGVLHVVSFGATL